MECCLLSLFSVDNLLRIRHRKLHLPRLLRVYFLAFSTIIDSYAADDLLKPLAIMFIASTYNYREGNRIRTDGSMGLHSLPVLMPVVPCGLATFFESMSVLSTAMVSRLSLPIA